MKTLVTGKLNLYKCHVIVRTGKTQPTLSPDYNGNLVMLNLGYPGRSYQGYCIAKKGMEVIPILKKKFRKEGLEFFNDHPNLNAHILNKEFKYDDLPELVKEFNR